MDLNQFLQTINSIGKEDKKFLAVNFGCRVNAAEINQLSQLLVETGYKPTNLDPDIVIINTCSITKKGDIESLSKARSLNRQYPKAKILVTGCANLKKLENISNVYTFDNSTKEKILESNNCVYTSEIGDKFSHTNRFILKIQSGCTQFCSYCIVPYQRQNIWSLNLDKAVSTINKITSENYKEVIITGVNLDQYSFGLSNLIEALLTKTTIKLISFGSIPINCIDDKFIQIYSNPIYKNRLQSFLHIPIQSGSNRILKLMNRPYDSQKILDTFKKLKSIKNLISREGLSFGTDVIVGFPGETDANFLDTVNLCKKIGFKKIHTFRYSSRPNTLAKFYYDKSKKIDKQSLISRSQQIRDLIQKPSSPTSN